MNPWTLFGWLIVSLLCLVIGVGIYAFSLWRGGPAWIPWATGTLIALCVALPTVFSLYALYKKRKGGTTTAPASAEIPPGRLPCWLLLDFGGLLAHLPAVLDGPGRPLCPDARAPRLWSTVKAHWIAVAAGPCPGPDAGDGPGAWEVLLRLLDEPGLRHRLSSPAGIVICLPMEKLASPGDESADEARKRLEALGQHLGEAPLWLIMIGPAALDELRRISPASLGMDSVLPEAPLGWFMPARRPWTPPSRWADAAAREGMKRIAGALDGLVRNADAGNAAPGRAVFLLGRDFRENVSALARLSASLGDGLRGVFWTALPSSRPEPPFLRGLFRETFPERRSLFPAGKRGRRLRAALAAACALLLAGGVLALQSGSDRAQSLLPDMVRLEEALHGPASVAALSDLTASFGRLERGCSGAVRLYGPPRDRLERLRGAVRDRIAASLPSPGAEERWIEELAQWASARPEVETIRFRAPDGTILARVDGAATAAGRAAAARFLDDLRSFFPTPPTGTGPASPSARIQALLLRYDASALAAWHGAGQRLLEAVRPADIDPHTLLPTRHVPLAPGDLLGPDNVCAAFLQKAESELRFAAEPPVWVASLRDLRRIRSMARLDSGGTLSSLNEAANLLGEPSAQARRTLERAETLLRARSAWTDCQSALTALLAEAGTEQGRIRLARALYGGDVDGGIRAADDAWQTLFAGLEARNPGLRNDPLALSLVRAPLLFVAGNATVEAARDLQQRWSSEVLAAVEGLQDESLQQALSGDGGLLATFAADAARPFLRPTSAGFAAASALGRRFPLSPDFLRFLTDTPQRMAVYPASYPVRVRPVPVTVNPKARAYPRGVSLRMDCGNEPLRADAYNYREELFFDWSPERCGGFTLTILFDGFEASLVHDGPFGFARFVDRASSGALDLTPADFPAVRPQLEAAGVTRIRCRFLIEGGEAVRRRLHALPSPVPRTILSGA